MGPYRSLLRDCLGLEVSEGVIIDAPQPIGEVSTTVGYGDDRLVADITLDPVSGGVKSRTP